MSNYADVPKTAVIVEDDPDIRHLLAEVLESAGFSTIAVGNGLDGVRAVQTYKPLLTTLDVNMPGIDGFEAARRIRAVSDTYIIMLTGMQDETDVVVGLGAGADEYLSKPFRPRELRARIEALLRRARTGDAAPTNSAPLQESAGPSFPGARPSTTAMPIVRPTYEEPPRPEVVELHQQQPPIVLPPEQQPVRERVTEYTPEPGTGLAPMTRRESRVALPRHEPGWLVHRDLELNPDTHIVLIRGDEVDLTRTEFDLLATLLESKRRVRSKADLTLVLRGESYVTSYFVGDADKRAVEAHMTNLRRKIGDNPVNPRYIETVRGVGYRLTSEVAA